jgi:hypothetical protein
MDGKLALVDDTLGRMAQLADELWVDPDGHVRRSVEELRAAFSSRAAIEPAVARVRESMAMIRARSDERARPEFQRRAAGLDSLGKVVEQELLPDLRGLGFEV